MECLYFIGDNMKQTIITKSGIKVTRLFEEEAEEWQECQNFNYAFHQHYTHKGDIIDGIIPERVLKISFSNLSETLENKEIWDE